MTNHQAYREAVKRWSKKGVFCGYVKITTEIDNAIDGVPVGIYRVGYTNCGHFTVKGQGNSWEEAFENAG